MRQTNLNRSEISNFLFFLCTAFPPLRIMSMLLLTVRRSAYHSDLCSRFFTVATARKSNRRETEPVAEFVREAAPHTGRDVVHDAVEFPPPSRKPQSDSASAGASGTGEKKELDHRARTQAARDAGPAGPLRRYGKSTSYAGVGGNQDRSRSYEGRSYNDNNSRSTSASTNRFDAPTSRRSSAPSAEGFPSTTRSLYNPSIASETSYYGPSSSSKPTASSPSPSTSPSPSPSPSTSTSTSALSSSSSRNEIGVGRPATQGARSSGGTSSDLYSSFSPASLSSYVKSDRPSSSSSERMSSSSSSSFDRSSRPPPRSTPSYNSRPSETSETSSASRPTYPTSRPSLSSPDARPPMYRTVNASSSSPRTPQLASSRYNDASPISVLASAHNDQPSFASSEPRSGRKSQRGGSNRARIRVVAPRIPPVEAMTTVDDLVPELLSAFRLQMMTRTGKIPSREDMQSELKTWLDNERKHDQKEANAAAAKIQLRHWKAEKLDEAWEWKRAREEEVGIVATDEMLLEDAAVRRRIARRKEIAVEARTKPKETTDRDHDFQLREARRQRERESDSAQSTMRVGNHASDANGVAPAKVAKIALTSSTIRKIGSRSSTPQIEEPRPLNPPGWLAHRYAMKKSFPDGWAPPKTVSREAVGLIRLLQQSNPLKYTSRVLADRFKISPEAVSRILKSTFELSPAESDRREMNRREERRSERAAAAESGEAEGSRGARWAGDRDGERREMDKIDRTMENTSGSREQSSSPSRRVAL